MLNLFASTPFHKGEGKKASQCNKARAKPSAGTWTRATPRLSWTQGVFRVGDSQIRVIDFEFRGFGKAAKASP